MDNRFKIPGVTIVGKIDLSKIDNNTRPIKKRYQAPQKVKNYGSSGWTESFNQMIKSYKKGIIKLKNKG